MCRLGIDPLVALRMVTLSPAEYFGLARRGGIAPGWLADMALVDSLELCRVEQVWKNGRLVAKSGKLCAEGKKTGLFFSSYSLPQTELEPIRDEAIGVSAQRDKGSIRVMVGIAGRC